MKQRFIMVLLFAILSLCFLSCERITSTVEDDRVSPFESIPPEYGSLISVTTDANYPRWSQMWFADDSGVIRMVRVNWQEKVMVKEIMTISRDESDL